MNIRICIALLALFSLPMSVRGQNINMKIGDSAPDWQDLIGVDDKKYSLAQFKERELLVIAFTCNSCPYAVDCEPRLVQFAKEMCGEGKKVALVAINANKVEEDLLPKMKERAEKQNFPFPYVWDETQSVARAYGALYAPEFFVFDKARKLVYHGAFDENAPEGKPRKTYLQDAVQATLAGEKVLLAETPAVGCAVRYERKRRKP